MTLKTKIVATGTRHWHPCWPGLPIDERDQFSTADEAQEWLVDAIAWCIERDDNTTWLPTLEEHQDLLRVADGYECQAGQHEVDGGVDGLVD